MPCLLFLTNSREKCQRVNTSCRALLSLGVQPIPPMAFRALPGRRAISPSVPPPPAEFLWQNQACARLAFLC